MTKIKFGTDGWRAIIALDYTVENVKRVTQGTANWLKEIGGTKVVIGHDCRFGGQMFAETTARVFGANGIKVHLAKGFVATPMVSLGVLQTKSDAGIVITASHNPPSYNGYKLKSAYGGPTIPKDIARVEELLPDDYDGALPALDEMIDDGLLNYIDLEEIYVKHVEENFDLDAIRNSGLKMAYDAMYGAGKAAVKRILPDVIMLHDDDNPGFHGQAPEPIHRNLLELSNLIKSDPTIDLGLANDGDADRIGMYDNEGNFVDAHHLLLLLLYYLVEHKGMEGKVVVSFSVTDKIKKLCDRYGLELEVVKIGFKHIAEVMIKEDVLLGGEESGGLASKGHIPERDGIWMGLLILEFMAKSGKSLKELIQEVYDRVGSFSYDRKDLHIAENKKQSIVEKCRNGHYKNFGDYKIIHTDDLDGFKYYFNDDEWVMIRPSGTEPVLRVYAQAPTREGVNAILKATHTALES